MLESLTEDELYELDTWLKSAHLRSEFVHGTGLGLTTEMRLAISATGAEREIRARIKDIKGEK